MSDAQELCAVAADVLQVSSRRVEQIEAGALAAHDVWHTGLHPAVGRARLVQTTHQRAGPLRQSVKERGDANISAVWSRAFSGQDVDTDRHTTMIVIDPRTCSKSRAMCAQCCPWLAHCTSRPTTQAIADKAR